MNICFLGTSCVGKTSVLEALKKDVVFKEWQFQESISRRLIEKGLLKRPFDSVENQKILFDEYVNILNQNNNCIYDRSIIDVFTFTKTKVQTNCDGFEKSELVRENRLLAQNIDKIDHIFYFPIYWECQDDGERVIDSEFLQLWDENIRNIQHFMNIKCDVIPNCSVIERVKFIKKKIFKK